MKKLSNKGFTLVELIIVIAILAIIMLIAIPNMSGIKHQMQVNSDKIEAAEIGKAVRMWYTMLQTDTATQNVVNKTAYLNATSSPKTYNNLPSSDPNAPMADSHNFAYMADLPFDGAMAHLCQLPKLNEFVETTETPDSIVDENGIVEENQYYFVGKTGSGSSEKIVVAIATSAPSLDKDAILTKADVLYDGKPIPTTGATNNSFAYVEQ